MVAPDVLDEAGGVIRKGLSWGTNLSSGSCLFIIFIGALVPQTVCCLGSI